MVLSPAIVCDRDRRIADDGRSMFPYNRRRSQTLLRSAIRDHMETSLNSQWKGRKAGLLSVSEFSRGYFNLPKIHPNRRDGMYQTYLVTVTTMPLANGFRFFS